MAWYGVIRLASFTVFKFNVLLKLGCLGILFKVKVSYCFVAFSSGQILDVGSF